MRKLLLAARYFVRLERERLLRRRDRQIWRHPRWLMPMCVQLVTLLSERRVRLFETVHTIRRKVTSTVFHNAHVLLAYWIVYRRTVILNAKTKLFIIREVNSDMPIYINRTNAGKNQMPRAGFEPTTPRSHERCSNHWATEATTVEWVGY